MKEQLINLMTRDNQDIYNLSRNKQFYLVRLLLASHIEVTNDNIEVLEHYFK
jgi:hypothetical protein